MKKNSEPLVRCTSNLKSSGLEVQPTLILYTMAYTDG